MTFPLVADEVVVYVIFEIDECDSVASYYLDVKIYWDNQDEDNESFFLQCEFDYV